MPTGKLNRMIIFFRVVRVLRYELYKFPSYPRISHVMQYRNHSTWSCLRVKLAEDVKG
jgi:hypothetical protein